MTSGSKRRIVTSQSRQTSTDGNKRAEGSTHQPDRGKKMGRFPVLLSAVVCAALGGTVILYYYKHMQSAETAFVQAGEIVAAAEQHVPCSRDYTEEPFKECIPKSCARVVMDGLVDLEDAKYLLGIAKKGLALGGSSGGASILDLHSGALSLGTKYINIYRYLKDEGITDLLTEDDFVIYRRVKNTIKEAIATKFGIPVGKLYLTKPTFFSRMTTTPPKTIHDEYWHVHIDKETYGSFHYTSLLYLSTYGEDFTGGRFIFVDKDANRTVEPRLGRVSFFTSGSENPHFVERLGSGIRYAITVSFTCDPDKAISDPQSDLVGPRH